MEGNNKIKKLEYSQIAEKYNKAVENYMVEVDAETNKTLSLMIPKLIQAIVDSINENIENEWIGSTVCFKLGGSIHNSKTGEQLIEWEAGDEFLCKDDKGQYISISVNGELHTIDKDSVYIVRNK